MAFADCREGRRTCRTRGRPLPPLLSCAMQVIEIGDTAAEPDHAEDDDDNAPDGGDAGAAKKKKKKKAKKKGGGGAAEDGTADAAAPPHVLPVEDGAARLAAALDALKITDTPPPEQLMLSRCGFGDKKLRAVLAALRGCGSAQSITALDLSHNQISDAGATQLCNALKTEGGLVPRLELLALEGNPLSAEASAACASALESRAELVLVLPASAAPNAAAASAGDGLPDVDAYYSVRPDGEIEAVANAATRLSGDAAESALTEKPMLVGAALALDAATTTLAAAVADDAGSSSEVLDALRTLIDHVDIEVAQLGATQSASTKFLPKALKWLSLNAAVLHTLLRPPAPARVTYGARAAAANFLSPGIGGGEYWRQRVGARRLLVVELITVLIGARRPPLTAALAEVRPPLVATALTLLPLHPASSVLGEALVRLTHAALQAKPLRAPLLAGAPPGVPSIQAVVAAALAAVPAPGAASTKGHGGVVDGAVLALDASRPVWMSLADELETLGQADKQVAEKLAAEPCAARSPKSTRAHARAAFAKHATLPLRVWCRSRIACACVRRAGAGWPSVRSWPSSAAGRPRRSGHVASHRRARAHARLGPTARWASYFDSYRASARKRDHMLHAAAGAAEVWPCRCIGLCARSCGSPPIRAHACVGRSHRRVHLQSPAPQRSRRDAVHTHARRDAGLPRLPVPQSALRNFRFLIRHTISLALLELLTKVPTTTYHIPLASSTGQPNSSRVPTADPPGQTPRTGSRSHMLANTTHTHTHTYTNAHRDEAAAREPPAALRSPK